MAIENDKVPTEQESRSPSHKALRINVDATRYGTFAEIGAGQEVARWFFHAGGAAGTVAKTISAYDMAVSDAVYGPSVRYVSRQRLSAMLEHEWKLLMERLDASRGERTCFFVFADTVVATSYSHPGEGHGWLGVRFQSAPRKPPSEIIIHVRLWDKENRRQQEALGLIGVNLIYGTFFKYSSPEKLIGSLMENLTRDRMEVDMIQFTGPDFAGVDNRLMSLQLVQQRLTNAAMFNPDGGVVEPAELLHERPVLVERGSFRPITRVTYDLLTSSLQRIRREPEMGGEEPVVLAEMTLRNLLALGKEIDHSDFLARVDTLGALGLKVMISNYSRFHNVTTYLRRYTHKRLGLALGIPTLVHIFEEKYYEDLEGGLLEALGRLFQGPVKLYVHPWKNTRTGEIVSVENFRVAPHLTHLYSYLLENHYLEPISDTSNEDLSVMPRHALQKLQAGDDSWEELVPAEAVGVIKGRGLFGHGSERGEEQSGGGEPKGDSGGKKP